MRLTELVRPNESFQTSVNINYDFGSSNRVRALIPTESVCFYLEDLLQDVIAASNQRAKLLVGPYGKGKSHITLAALSSMWIKDPQLFERIAEGYKTRGWQFAETFEQFVKDGKRLLPVAISGGTSDLRHALLSSLRNALRLAGLDDLMPTTNFNAALDTIERWRKSYPETLQRLEEATGEDADVLESRIRNMETAAYDLFVNVYPSLTSGGFFDPLSDGDVIDVYEKVLAALRRVGVSGIYVVYDEFSKYLEANIASASIEDIKLLQDFAERCNRSSQDQQLHLLLISHKSLRNYIDARLPKEKVDGWLGISGRFREIEIISDANQSYELMANAIVKDAESWQSWLENDNGRNELRLESAKRRYIESGLIDHGNDQMVVYGCFPLHPVAAFLLPLLSEKVAQNERTLFTYLCSEEENSLMRTLASSDYYVSPDSIFDYFEPLLRKERYSSPLHKSYELAKISLSKVERGSLESKIIKTIALIGIVSRFDSVSPTRQSLVNIYCDCGYSEAEVLEAIANLVGVDSVVYLRQSNSFLKLKESSGVRIDIEIADRAEALRNSVSVGDILNDCLLSKALYPSRHNQTHSVIRYFDCAFISSKELTSLQQDGKSGGSAADGSVLAVFPESPDDLKGIDESARNYSAVDPLSVVIAPKKYEEISDVLYRRMAALLLKDEAGEDEVLAEEYEIAIDDYDEIITAYIDAFFRPELGQSRFYANGGRKYNITRKSKLSELLSTLCDAAFPKTPRITSEALNKNELTGTALHSRARILNGLCGTALEPNLGFVGNGQETSMMRSALVQTRIIPDIEKPVPNFHPAGKGSEHIGDVFDVIIGFIENSNGLGFDVLYEKLTGKDNQIAMKKGPIPLFLALALRDRREEIVITRDGEERAFCAELLDDIDANPELYSLARLDWTPQMASYVSELAEVFACPPAAGRASVADAMRRWYVTLPQLTRNAKENHALGERSRAEMESHRQFFRALKRIDLDANKLLFEAIPSCFGLSVDDPQLIDAIKAEKSFCDGYIDSVVVVLSDSLKSLFDPGAHEDSSLSSVIKDWLEGLLPSALSHVFSGASNNIILALKSAVPDDTQTVGRLAKAATSLRIEDWNDARFQEFEQLMATVRAEAESFEADDAADEGTGELGIIFIGEDGSACKRTFDSVECSKRANLLKNSILSSIDEMGRSLSEEEKRQVVFEVLKGMC